MTGHGRPIKIGELSFLDFAGEVYRAAFVRKEEPDGALGNAVVQLKQYLLDADSVIVLVNLSDVIKYGPFSPRVEESPVDHECDSRLYPSRRGRAREKNAACGNRAVAVGQLQGHD